MDEQHMEEARKIVTDSALRMVREIMASKTKYAVELSRLLEFYNANLDKAPPASKDCSFAKEVQRVARILKELHEDREKRKSLHQGQMRKLYEERTGQKWRPSLIVIQGGGNTTPITRTVTRQKKP
jgi:hypothetical protein